MSDAPMKLYYYDSGERGQPIRYALECGHVNYDEIRFSEEDWPQFKSKSPSGQCPFIEFADGSIMTESLALLLFACQKAGNEMIPSCPKALGCGMMMIQTFEASFPEFIKLFKIPEAERAAHLPAVLAVMNKQVALMQSTYKNLYPKQTSKFLFGDKPTFADFYVASMMEKMTVNPPLPGLSVEVDVIEKTFPEFVAVMKSIWNIPEIKSYNDKHKLW